MTELERRIQRLEDRAALQDLAVRYFVATDDDDYEALADMFAPDAKFRAGGFDGGSSRDEIIAFLRAVRSNMGVTIHTPDYSLITFHDDDHATGVVGAHLEIAVSGQSMYGAVRYEDGYVRLDGRWLFSRREMLYFHMGPWQDIANSLTSGDRVRWPGADPQPAELPKK